MSSSLAVPTPFEDLPRNADVRLIAVDMDGTLLGDDKEIPPRLWPVLGQLADRGITFAPASGRQVWTLLDMFDSVSQGLTVIAENGAIVMRDGEEVSSTPMDHATVAEVVRLVRESVAGGQDAGLMMCGIKSGYVERTDAPFLAATAPYYHRTKQVADQLQVLGDIEAGILDDAIIKLAVFCFDSVLPIASAAMEPFANTHQFVVSGHNWADLQMRGVDKGFAVQALQRHLGVTSAQTVCFGDFHNDLGMLAAADLSFAMANAHPDVVAAARYVAPSNNEDGVLRVLTHMLGLD